MKNYKFQLKSPKRLINVNDKYDKIVLTKIDEKVKEVCPIHGLSFVNALPLTIIVHAKRSLTNEEQKKAKEIIESYDHEKETKIERENSPKRITLRDLEEIKQHLTKLDEQFLELKL